MATTHVISTSNQGEKYLASSGSHSSSSSNIVGVHYKVGKKIGEGSFGVIFEGECMIRSMSVLLSVRLEGARGHLLEHGKAQLSSWARLQLTLFAGTNLLNVQTVAIKFVTPLLPKTVGR